MKSWWWSHMWYWSSAAHWSVWPQWAEPPHPCDSSPTPVWFNPARVPHLLDRLAEPKHPASRQELRGQHHHSASQPARPDGHPGCRQGEATRWVWRTGSGGHIKDLYDSLTSDSLNFSQLTWWLNNVNIQSVHVRLPVLSALLSFCTNSSPCVLLRL